MRLAGEHAMTGAARSRRAFKHGRALLWAALGATLLATAGCAVWRAGEARELARRSEPFEQRPAGATRRLLIAGDSTAVGTGASSPAHSLAGLIAQQQPRLLIENRARDGALFADVAEQLLRPGRFDAVLVQAGGNDVIRLRGADDMRADIERVLEAARQRADVVVLMPAGNVGNAPFFFAPWSWWMTRRAREMHRLAESASARADATYVKLFQEREDDPFVRQPELNASDGLHPSDAGYRVWWQQLQAQSDLLQRLVATP
jgi:lysophospholipase L1-like esterase